MCDIKELEEKKEYVLAMYDIRGKQEFIFRTNRIKEIVGASKVIEDIFTDYLFRKSTILHNSRIPFTWEGFQEHLNEGFVGEVVYEGGGNFILLYKNEEEYKKATFEFTKEVKKKIGSLRVLGACVPVDSSLNDYKSDEKRLYAEHARLEASETNIGMWQSIPVVQVDRRTSFPLTEVWKEEWGICPDKGGKVSKDSAVKYKKYCEEYPKQHLEENQTAGDEFGEKIFDNIVTEKGKESLLAVVYIDGNNMGQQVQDCLEGKKTYEECVAELRKFSSDIQKNYVDEPLARINEKLGEKYGDNKKHRYVVYAGDEINFICNARDAYKLALEHLSNLPQGCSACAGIAIFNSHSPYSDAYRIAEECCETGKKLMKEKGYSSTSFIDFHYCQGATGSSLESIRKRETDSVISKPWLIKFDETVDKSISDNIPKADDVEELSRFLKMLGRSNVKGLLAPALTGDNEFEMEIMRIKAHMKEPERKAAFKIYDDICEKYKGEMKIRYLLYDMIITFDLWFREE